MQAEDARPKRFRIYIDESGDHTYDINRQFLCLLGIIIEGNTYKTQFHPSLEKLKQKHFPHCPDAPVILHREDIIARRGPFKVLRDQEKNKQYEQDLLDFFASHEYKIIAVTIDKIKQKEQYGKYAYHPYNFCLELILERYCRFLEISSAIGDVLVESRGKKEDLTLKEAYDRIYQNGTMFMSKDLSQKTLTSHEIKLRKKSSNILGLQVADLLAGEVNKQILIENGVKDDGRTPFAKSICDAIDEKFNCKNNGRIKGYGRILFPNRG